MPRSRRRRDKADLRLDRRDVAIEARAFVPGSRTTASLSTDLRHGSRGSDAAAGPAKNLTGSRRNCFKQWIAAGAEYQGHWSFITPQRPQLPAVKDAGLVRNPIDRFVLAKLEQSGLTPAPEADRRTLARRVSLDLTGLPPDAGGRRGIRRPTSARRLREAGRPLPELAALGRTSRPLLARRGALRRHARAALRQLSRDVALPRLGHQGVQHATCASTSSPSSNSPAICSPNPTDEQEVATGFQRCNITTNEGGTIEDENLANYANDRVTTTSLGLPRTDRSIAAPATTTSSIRSPDATSTRWRRFTGTPRRAASTKTFAKTPPFMVVPQTDRIARAGRRCQANWQSRERGTKPRRCEPRG